jgi:hypothetical protein
MEYAIGIILLYVICAVLVFSISRRNPNAMYAAVPGDNWTSRLQRRFALPLGWFYPLVAVQVGYKRQIDGRWRPGRLWIGWATVEDGEHEESLFRNGVLFARLALPGCIALGIRWGKLTRFSWAPAAIMFAMKIGGARFGRLMTSALTNDHWDLVLGWRPNGVPGASFRFQSDESSAAGYDIPNSGQAQGFNDGWR